MFLNLAEDNDMCVEYLFGIVVLCIRQGLRETITKEADSPKHRDKCFSGPRFISLHLKNAYRHILAVHMPSLRHLEVTETCMRHLDTTTQSTALDSGKPRVRSLLAMPRSVRSMHCTRRARKL